MSNKKNDYLIILLVMFYILFLIGGAIYVQNLKITSKETSQAKETENKKQDTMSVVDKKETSQETSNNEENKMIDNTNVNEIIKVPNEEIKNESDVISYVEDMENTVLQVPTSNINDWKIKSKKLFITLVDFIFYDGKIGDYTFQELSDSGKQKVIDIAMHIDQTIESYCPNYKEKLVSQGKRTYYDVSEKLTNCKNEYLNNVKEFLGDENYQKTEEMYGNVKEKTNTVKEKVVEKGKDIYDKGKEVAEKAKEKWNDWYQSFKEK